MNEKVHGPHNNYSLEKWKCIIVQIIYVCRQTLLVKVCLSSSTAVPVFPCLADSYRRGPWNDEERECRLFSITMHTHAPHPGVHNSVGRAKYDENIKWCLNAMQCYLHATEFIITNHEITLAAAPSQNLNEMERQQELSYLLLIMIHTLKLTSLCVFWLFFLHFCCIVIFWSLTVLGISKDEEMGGQIIWAGINHCLKRHSGSHPCDKTVLGWKTQADPSEW